MKWMLVAFSLAAVSWQSVLSYRYQECGYETCQYYHHVLAEIDKMITTESAHHQFNLYYDGGTTPDSRVNYILRALNNKILSFSNPQRSRGNIQNGFGCKQLEDEILAKGKEFGIEKIGLENNLVRLNKVLSYQDERNRFNEDLLNESNNKTQACVHSKSELENKVKSLNSKTNEQAKKIKQLEDNIKSLEMDKKRLHVKLNANAPSIHGQTGKIYPEVNNTIPTIEADGPAITSTTEITVFPASSNATATVADESEVSPIPDIDLRNTGDNSS